MRMSHFKIPNGGWVYWVGKIKFTGYTFDDLVKVVIAHQKSNSLPISSVKDIEDQIRKDHPELIIN